jgi:hypothetical protein
MLNQNIGTHCKLQQQQRYSHPPHRGPGPPGQGCGVGGGGPLRHRLLQPRFLGPQEIGGVASDYRPIPSKPLPQGTAFQDGDNSVGR